MGLRCDVFLVIYRGLQHLPISLDARQTFASADIFQLLAGWRSITTVVLITYDGETRLQLCTVSPPASLGGEAYTVATSIKPALSNSSGADLGRSKGTRGQVAGIMNGSSTGGMHRGNFCLGVNVLT